MVAFFRTLVARWMSGLLSWLAFASAAKTPAHSAPAAAGRSEDGMPPVKPVAFLLAERLRSTAALNTPKGVRRLKRRRQAGRLAVARPLTTIATVKKQPKETRHVWLRTRHAVRPQPVKTGAVVALRLPNRTRPALQPLKRAA